jgi:hypothetical protein
VSGDITIPVKIIYNGTEYNVAKIYEETFYTNYKLNSVRIPTSIYEIGNHVFEGLHSGNTSKLKSVDFYNAKDKIQNLTTIGTAAFRYCYKLSSIKIPSSVTDIGTCAFFGCSQLSNLEFEKLSRISSIKAETFHNCTSLTSIELPDGLTFIGKQAFSTCSSLTSIKFPDSLKNIETEAFDTCTSLTSIELPDSLADIGVEAFWNCTALTSIKLPKAYDTLDTSILSRCESLKKIIGNGVTKISKPSCLDSAKDLNQLEFDSLNDLKDLSTFLDCLKDKNNLELTLTGLKNIVLDDKTSVFQGRTNIASVDISGMDSTSLPDNAFSGCTGLTSVTLPDNLESIGDNAFSNCGTTKSSDGTAVGLNIDLSGVKTISGSAFSNSGLTTADLISAETIKDNAFSGCKQLSSVTLSDNLTSLGTGAFSGCSDLTSIDLPDTITAIPESAFKSSGLKKITINYGVKKIGASAFEDCKNLESIAIPVTVSQSGIDMNAFFDCNLKSITCPCTYSLNELFGDKNGIVPNGDDTFQQKYEDASGNIIYSSDKRSFHIIHDWSWKNTENKARLIATNCRMNHFDEYEKKNSGTPLVQLEVVLDSKTTEISGSFYYKATLEQVQEESDDKEVKYLTEGNTPPIVYYQKNDKELEITNPVSIDKLTRMSTPIPASTTGTYYATITTNYGIKSDYGDPLDEGGVTAFVMYPDNNPGGGGGGGTTSNIITKTYGDPPFDLTTVGLPDDANGKITYTSSDDKILRETLI